MALTKSFNQAVLERARADREYRIGLLEEAVGLYKSGEDAVGLKMVEQFLAAEGQAPAAGPWRYDVDNAPCDKTLLIKITPNQDHPYGEYLGHRLKDSMDSWVANGRFLKDKPIAYAKINTEGI